MVQDHKANVIFNQATQIVADVRGGGHGQMIGGPMVFYGLSEREVRIGDPEHNITISNQLPSTPGILCELEYKNITIPSVTDSDGVEITLKTYAKLRPDFLDVFQEDVHMKAFFVKELLKQCEKEHLKNTAITGGFEGVGLAFALGLTAVMLTGKLHPAMPFLAIALGIGVAAFETLSPSENWGSIKTGKKSKEITKEEVLAKNFTREEIEASIKAEYDYLRSLSKANKHQLHLAENREVAKWTKGCPAEVIVT